MVASFFEAVPFCLVLRQDPSAKCFINMEQENTVAGLPDGPKTQYIPDAGLAVFYMDAKDGSFLFFLGRF